MMRFAGSLGLIGTTLLFAASAQAGEANFAGDLDPSQEVTPAVGLDGHKPNGGAVFTYDDATKTLCGRIEYDDLTGPPTGIHMHQAPMGQPHADGPATAKVIIPIGPSGLVFKVVLDSAWERSLAEGEIYTNVHTATNAKGEIRATMDPCPECNAFKVECPAGDPLPLGVPADPGTTDGGATTPDPTPTPDPPSTSNGDTSDGTSLVEPPAPAPKAKAGGCNTATNTSASGGALALVGIAALAFARIRRRQKR